MTSDRYRAHTMPLNIADWCQGTEGLTLEEQGAYLRICVAIYSHGASIPDDDKALARRLGLTSVRTLRRIKSALIEAGKIRVEDGLIIQERCLKELGRMAAKSSVRSSAAHRRWAGKETSQNVRNTQSLGQTSGKLPANSSRRSIKSHSDHRGAESNKNNGMENANADAIASGARMQMEMLYPRPENQHPADAGIDDDLEAYRRGEDAAKRWLFDDGLSYLTHRRIPDKRARAVIGVWLKHHSAELVKEVIDRTSERADIAEPIPYINTALKQRQQELETNESHIIRTDYDRALENWAGGNCVGPEPKREDFE